MVTAGASSTARFHSLPGPAHAFVAGTIALAAIVLVAPFPATIPYPVLFTALAIASCLASPMKGNLPLGASSSNALRLLRRDFAGLLILGASQTMLIAGFSELKQSTFTTRRNSGVPQTVPAADAFAFLSTRPLLKGGRAARPPEATVGVESSGRSIH
jgi:hypothetical protein